MLDLIRLIIALSVLVVSSRLIITEVSALARRMHVRAFGLSMLILGFLTSLTELGVAINAQIDGYPEIYAGNLMGGSFLILTFIIPLLAMLRGGLPLASHISHKGLLVFVGLVSVPLLLALDGVISRMDAAAMVVSYAVFLIVNWQQQPKSNTRAKPVSLPAIAKGVAKIALAGGVIFLTTGYLVAATETFALALGIPAFIVSLIMLAIGTNVPELSLAVNALLKKRADIAFGDFVGSAAMNTLIFGFFAMLNGSFAVRTDGFAWLLPAFLAANLAFLAFAMSKKKITVMEAATLVCAYGAFVVYQAFTRV